MHAVSYREVQQGTHLQRCKKTTAANPFIHPHTVLEHISSLLKGIAQSLVTDLLPLFPSVCFNRVAAAVAAPAAAVAAAAVAAAAALAAVAAVAAEERC